MTGPSHVLGEGTEETWLSGSASVGQGEGPHWSQTPGSH